MVLRTASNAMAVEDYTLLQLRTRIAEEFGLDSAVTAVGDMIDRKINDALQWLKSRLRLATWSRLPTSIQVGDTSTSTTTTTVDSGRFDLAQLTVSGTLGTASTRQIVNLSGGDTDGFVIQSIASDVYTLDAPFIGGDANKASITGMTLASPAVFTVSATTVQSGDTALPDNGTTFEVSISGILPDGAGPTVNGIQVATKLTATTFSIAVDTSVDTYTLTAAQAHCAKDFSILEGIFQLPEDFETMISVHVDSALDGTGLNPVTHSEFENHIRQKISRGQRDRIYTIVSDPLKTSDRRFLMIYPYYSDRQVIRAQYHGDVPQLVADGDIPLIPRQDRLTLFYVAGWFVATHQKEAEMVPFYRDMGMQLIDQALSERMHDDFSQDKDNMHGLGVPQAGGNYPEFTVD